jgi:hypothetical protein
MVGVGILAGVVLLGACSREPASTKGLAAERALADSLVAGMTPAQPESLRGRVEAARAATSRFLDRHPKDIPGALVFVKLRLAEAALAAPDDSALAGLDHTQRSITLKERKNDCLPVLDRAIALAPKSPEPYYWKSLILGLWEPIFGEHALDPENSRLAEAVASASKAVALAPDSASYRSALASYQMLSGDDRAAVATLRAGKDANDPTLRLLEDWERFPVPPSAIVSRKESAGIAEWLSMSGLDDAHARVRAFWVPGTADSIRAFYGRGAKGMFWMTQPAQVENGETWRYASAALFFDKDGYRPLREQDLKTGAMAQAEGVSIQIREVRGPSSVTRKAIPFEPGTAVCELLLTNHRRVRQP